MLEKCKIFFKKEEKYHIHFFLNNIAATLFYLLSLIHWTEYYICLPWWSEMFIAGCVKKGRCILRNLHLSCVCSSSSYPVLYPFSSKGQRFSKLNGVNSVLFLFLWFHSTLKRIFTTLSTSKKILKRKEKNIASFQLWRTLIWYSHRCQSLASSTWIENALVNRYRKFLSDQVVWMK